MPIKKERETTYKSKRSRGEKSIKRLKERKGKEERCKEELRSRGGEARMYYNKTMYAYSSCYVTIKWNVTVLLKWSSHSTQEIECKFSKNLPEILKNCSLCSQKNTHNIL